MAWPEVSPTHVEERWRPLTDAETTVAERRIEDAEDELQHQLGLRGVLEPSDDERWMRRYRRTVADMVRRYLLNPEAWLEESTQIDDYSKTRRRDSAVSSGLLYVTDEEVAALLPKLRRRRGAFSVRLGES